MATYSGVAAPASPASTSTMSPGVSWRTRKLTTMMTRTVGTAWARRRARTRATPGRASIIRAPARQPRQPASATGGSEGGWRAEKGPEARRRPTAAREAYSLYAERAAEGANEADGPFSSRWLRLQVGVAEAPVR